MNGTIIFRLRIRKEFGGFAAASNFIAKMENQQQLCAQEVCGIENYLYKEKELPNNRKIVEILTKNSMQFLNISKPEKLIEGSQGYHIAYCLMIEEQEIDDVVEMQYYYLIRKYYSDLTLMAIISGTYDFYYKISHYFVDESLKNEIFYNSIFYDSDRISIRLQKKKVEKTKDFVSIQCIDESTMKDFQIKVKEIISRKEMIGYLMEDCSADGNRFSPSLRGCLELLGRSSSLVKKIDVEEVADRLLEGSLLSFMLFSYSFYDCMKKTEGRKEVYTTESVNSLYKQIQECTICCQQLIENVVLHSSSGVGALSIRFHSKKTPYLLKRYGKLVKNIPHLEILITDYAGINEDGNLAANFIKNIKNDTEKAYFQDLQPIDFLTTGGERGEREAKVERAFKEYYSNSENIGRHFGLKIFNSIINQNKGFFSFYSHNGHRIKEGESWGFQEELHQDQYVQCMPGTSYSILFPLEPKKNVVTRAQAGIDENLEMQEKISLYIRDYSCDDLEVPLINDCYSSQEEKEGLIRNLAEQLKYDSGSETGKQVLYISAEQYPEEYAEYFCKALLIAGYGRAIPDYVFYNCRKGFVNVFQQSINSYFTLGTMEYAFQDKDFIIALFTKKPIEETIIIPSSLERTRLANKFCGFSGGEERME